MALLTSPGVATVTHPRLVRRTAPSLDAVGWSRDDTLFVVLLFAAVLMCALVPLALL